MLRHQRFLVLCLVAFVAQWHAISLSAQSWPTARQEAKPGVRWWWPGSAVDKSNLQWSLQSFSRAGFGTVEITPIYGVEGNEGMDIPYLSPRWMEMLRYTQAEGKRQGIATDMSTGTGWPFGGPWVPLEESACKAIFADTIVGIQDKLMDIEFRIPEADKATAKLKMIKAFPVADDKRKKRVIALYVGRTQQRVKRAAPGGEGYVVDHFDATAVKHYLAHLDSAFRATGTEFPHTFFCDSYEVYDADWTPTLLDAFKEQHGYELEEHFPELLDGDEGVVSDYRETLSTLLLRNFTEQWTAWVHERGATARYQAHGSPANLIDCYAAADIPEAESYGMYQLRIRDLRTDSIYTPTNYCDPSMLKHASSAAHITGKPLTSCETGTWLTEHFRTSLSQLKPELDLLFSAGINHVFFHGATYSPKNAKWPGWKFYASVDMSPTNSIWRDARAMNDYITRAQTFLQWGEPDNEFLVYLPIRDMWRENTKQRFTRFDIHLNNRPAPQFYDTVARLDSMGYAWDYVSDQYLMTTTVVDGMLQTAAGTRYKALIIPGQNIMSTSLIQHIASLKAQGATILQGINADKLAQVTRAEELKAKHQLHITRRKNDAGHHYFIANLTDRDIDAPVDISAPHQHALWYDPMTDTKWAAEMANGKLRVCLRSGESRILLCSDQPIPQAAGLRPEPVKAAGGEEINLTRQEWKLSFVDEQPTVGQTFKLEGVQPWEQLSDKTNETMGTGIYETTVKLSKSQAEKEWFIDLGDVRESARVYINDQLVGCAWAAPFTLHCKDLLRKGKNTLRIEVTNLPANRIRHMDKRGEKWRTMKDINMVDIHYQPSNYGDWVAVPSGLNDSVFLKEAR